MRWTHFDRIRGTPCSTFATTRHLARQVGGASASFIFIGFVFLVEIFLKFFVGFAEIFFEFFIGYGAKEEI